MEHLHFQTSVEEFPQTLTVEAFREKVSSLANSFECEEHPRTAKPFTMQTHDYLLGFIEASKVCK
jgi:hypothetical protein